MSNSSRQVIFKTLLACAVLFPCACVPRSTYPVGEFHESQQDQSLYGCWVLPGESTQFLFIGRAMFADPEILKNEKDKETRARFAKLSGLMTARRFTIAKNQVIGPFNLFGDSPDGERTLMWVTHLGGRSYANVVDFDSGMKTVASGFDLKEASPPWDKAGAQLKFFKYRVVNNKLEVWVPDMSLAVKAVEAGIVKGKILRDKEGKSFGADFTEHTDGLARLLKSDEGDQALFTAKPGRIYTRAKITLEN